MHFPQIIKITFPGSLDHSAKSSGNFLRYSRILIRKSVNIKFIGLDSQVVESARIKLMHLFIPEGIA